MGCDAEDIALTIHAHRRCTSLWAWRQKCSKVALPTAEPESEEEVIFRLPGHLAIKKRLTTPLFLRL